MILLDTNILVYAANKDSDVFQAAKDIRNKAVSGNIDACISLQNLAEFYSVITDSKRVLNPLGTQQAKEEVEKYLVCTQIKKIEVKQSTINLAIELARKYNIVSQDYFDAQLVAAMVENNVQKILTRNAADFNAFVEIEKENPFVSIPTR